MTQLFCARLARVSGPVSATIASTKIASTKTVSKNRLSRMQCGYAILLLGLVPVSQAQANEDGTFGRSSSGCISCHSGDTSSNSGYSAKVYKTSVSADNQLFDATDQLSKNVPITFVVRLDGTGASRGGFVLKTSTGTFSAGGDTTSASDEITHTDSNGVTVGGGKIASGGDVNWSFTYNPPNSVTTATFNVCGNPVDGDGDGNPDDDDGPSVCSLYSASIINNAPVPDSESSSVGENGTVNITDATLLFGDTDANSDTLSVTGFTQPSGVATVTDNGASVTYNPNTKYDYLGALDSVIDTFGYQLHDGTATVTGTVSITVNGANDPPIGVADTVTVDISGTATTVVGGSTSVLTNDTDADAGEALTNQAQLVSAPANHDVAMAGAFSLQADGTFSYTHDGSVALDDSFTYRVSDGPTTSGIVTVNIQVANTAPVAVDDSVPPVATVLEGGSINFTVLDNDTDAETMKPTAVINISSEIGGTATIQPDQSVTFVHNGTEDPASFRYQANDGFLTSAGTALVTLNVTPVNDPPVIGTINNFSDVEGNPISLNPGVTDPDNTNGVDITWSFVSGNPAGMTISLTGLVEWIPPPGPPAVFNQSYPIVIQADDGEFTDTESFTIMINPPDDDSDLVANYDDLCLTVPSLNNGENFDNDGDGVAGADGTGTIGTPQHDSSGGDVCDDDDDNDGMPDTFETANAFDPFNGVDASEDADGDGISNLQEFTDNTNPTEANVAIDATGYLTPYDLNLVPPVPTDIHLDATAVTAIFAKRPTDQANPYGPYRPGDNTITWRASNGSDSDLISSVPARKVSDPSEQPFFIRPLVSFDVDQQVEENGSVTVTVRLNGDAPTWEATPIGSVTVDYSVSGTASNPGDHNAISGTVTFVVDDYEEAITFNVIADGVVDPNETIVLQLTNATNAVIGSKQTHTVTILEDNIAPRAALQFTQGGSAVGATFDDSPIMIDAMASDANGAQVLSCDWSGTDNALIPPGIVSNCRGPLPWTVNLPVAGNYLVDVVVTDNGSPVKSTHVSRILHVAVPPAVALNAANDSDMDGINDSAEGYADPDGDGIPAYLDDIDGTVAGANLMPNQTADMPGSLLLETESGLTLRRGSTTQAANVFGALVSDSDIEQSGGPSGGAPVNSEDSFVHVGGIYDFEIDGLIPGSSVSIVIPLQSAIPRNASYRKFNSATGWSDFVVDANNLIASASGELGACPEPGSGVYRSGLNYLDNCIQLTIQDGGLNDTDNTVNGVINDPSSVGVELRDPDGFDEVEDGSGGGRMSPLLLTMLLVFGGLAFWRRRRGFCID